MKHSNGVAKWAAAIWVAGSFFATDLARAQVASSASAKQAPDWRASVSKAPVARKAVDPAAGGYAISAQDLNWRRWARVTWQTNAAGQLTLRTNSFVELSTGLNYYAQNGKLLESRAAIESVPGGAVARQGRHQVTFANDVATSGAIDVQLPDGQRMRSHVLGLSYVDRASGRSALIAAVTNCQGEIVASNQVVYAGAFRGVKADVRYTYTKAGLAQDVVFREQPPAPETFGLDPETTELQVLTEFLEMPTPRKTPRVLKGETNQVKRAGMVQPDRVDFTLDFGAMRTMPGTAFGEAESRGARTGAPVAKQLQTIEGRQILIEGAEWRAVSAQIGQLPRRAAAADGARRQARGERELPARLPGAALRDDGPQMASATLLREPNGFVIDYEMVTMEYGYTYQFSSETTYLITDSVYFDAVYFEAGAVIKYAPDTYLYASQVTENPGACGGKTILTAVDDDTVGEDIDSQPSTPEGYYAYDALWMIPGQLDDYFTLQNLDIRYATIGISVYSGYPGVIVSNCWFLHCGTGALLNMYYPSYLSTSDMCDVGTWCDGWAIVEGITQCQRGIDDDTDCDGMPDWWMNTHFGHPHGQASDNSRAQDDYDGDGVNNLQEKTDGTNPCDQWVVAWGKASNYGQYTAPAGLGGIAAIDGGVFHTLALSSNGTVAAWGDNTYGQTNVPAGWSNVVSIAAAYYQSAAVTAGGVVTNWGLTWGVVPANLTNAVAVSAGGGHILALRRDGTVTAWGDNSYGQTDVPALSPVKQVAGGFLHSAALQSNGTVVVWGLNGEDAGWNITNVPTGLSNVTAIAAGLYHTLALKADGTAAAWGAGNGSDTLFSLGQSIVPAALSNVIAIAAGGYNSMALRADGTVVAWGEVGGVPYGLTGVVAIGAGDGHCLAVRTGRQTPLVLQHPVSQCATNGQTVTFSGAGAGPSSVGYQWQFNGANIAGQTNATLSLPNVQPGNEGNYRMLVSNGAGTTASLEATLYLPHPPMIGSRTQPAEQTLLYGSTLNLGVQVTLPGGCDWPPTYSWSFNGASVDLPSGTNCIVGVKAANAGVYAVGITNIAGGTNVSWTIHVAGEGAPIWWGGDTQAWHYLPDLQDTIALAGGGQHNLLMRESGTVVGWGANDSGQTNVPAGLTNAVAIAAGEAHSLALKADGTVAGWGRNDSGQTNTSTVTDAIAISAGGNQSLALKSNGTVTQWGQTNAPVPAGLMKVTAIASGTNFHLALLTNGTVVAWGANNCGQTNVPAGLTNVVALAAGGAHALALRGNGTVVAWGANGSGETNTPASLTNVLAVAAGYAHSVALRNDGSVVAWGDNSSGQTNVPAGLGPVKLIAAGKTQTLVSMFSPLVQYPVDVTKDLLLIYNTNSADSIAVKDYYLAHRPMVGGANVLGIGCPAQETVTRADFTNNIKPQILTWLTNHPTVRPQYWILFLDIPSRMSTDTNATVEAYSAPHDQKSVSYELHSTAVGIPPFVMHLNMNGTNDCIGYINKLAAMGSNSPGKLILSASAVGYGNTNYYFDDTRPEYYSPQPWVANNAQNGVLAVNPSASVIYTNVAYGGTLADHITRGTNVAGYLSWGYHGYFGGTNGAYGTNGTIVFNGSSGWWIIETIESENGQRYQTLEGTIIRWFASNAFGGANYSNTPVGAVSHTDEPELPFVNDAFLYFGNWVKGDSFARSAWNSRKTTHFQAVGDPFVVR